METCRMKPSANMMLPNLAVEGIFTFLFGPCSMRWGRDGGAILKRNDKPSATVRSFSVLRSLNVLFWQRSYEFFLTPNGDNNELRFDENVPPWTIFQRANVTNLSLLNIRDAGKLDLSSFVSVKKLGLPFIHGHFSLTPPPNLDSLMIAADDVDVRDLENGLKDSKIVKVEIWGGLSKLKELDLSRILSIQELDLRDVDGNFSLTPPPNILKLMIAVSNIDIERLIRALKKTKIQKIEIAFGVMIKKELNGDVERLDMSSLLSVSDLSLTFIDERLCLTPPPRIENLEINNSYIDIADLIENLKETQIRTLTIESKVMKSQPAVDLYGLNTLSAMYWEGPEFPLSLPPNLKILSFRSTSRTKLNQTVLSSARHLEIMELRDFWSNEDIDLSCFQNLRALKLSDCYFGFVVPPTVMNFELNRSSFNGNWISAAKNLRRVRIGHYYNTNNWNRILDLRHCDKLEIAECPGPENDERDEEDEEEEEEDESITVLAGLVPLDTTGNVFPALSTWAR